MHGRRQSDLGRPNGQEGQREARAPTERSTERGGTGQGTRSSCSLTLPPDSLPWDGQHGFEDVMGVRVAYGMDGVRDGAGCVGPSPPGLRLPPCAGRPPGELSLPVGMQGWAPQDLGTWAPAYPNLSGRPALHRPPWAHSTLAPSQATSSAAGGGGLARSHPLASRREGQSQRAPLNLCLPTPAQPEAPGPPPPLPGSHRPAQPRGCVSRWLGACGVRPPTGSCPGCCWVITKPTATAARLPPDHWGAPQLRPAPPMVPGRHQSPQLQGGAPLQQPGGISPPSQAPAGWPGTDAPGGPAEGRVAQGSTPECLSELTHRWDTRPGPYAAPRPPKRGSALIPHPRARGSWRARHRPLEVAGAAPHCTPSLTGGHCTAGLW